MTKTNANGKEVSLFIEVAKLSASVHRTNSCAACHSDITPKHPDDNLRVEPVDCSKCHRKESETYRGSVHGLATKDRREPATCADCHGAHTIAPPTSPDSPLHFSRLAQTCGACHDEVAREVSASVHGKAIAAGHRDAPTCTDCHSQHRIAALKNSSPLRISTGVCSSCHGSERLNTKYNLPPDRVKTFFESYHGLAAQYGSTVTANCASCHGVHKILPSSDPDSSINKAHLIATCGKCHPGATENFVESKVHVDSAAANSRDGMGQKINYWVRRAYLGLIITVIGVMLLHNGLSFARKVSARLRKADLPVLRMTLSQRWQHWILAISFVVLAMTGFALKFPDSWIAKLLGSNEILRSWTHRIAGIVLLGAGAYHLLYLFVTREGRSLGKDLLPGKSDLRDLRANSSYLAGLTSTKPSFARFNYAEKLEYWAVVWGTIIMGVTGSIVWFKLGFTAWLPRWAVDIALTIHYYEAILACLAILVWHFYHVIFDPDVYPFNTACWKGRVSRDWQKHEHPLDSSTCPPAVIVSREQPSVAVPAVVTGTAPGTPSIAGNGRKNPSDLTEIGRRE
jgi:formate dehydrogenase gamma subunit